LNGSDNLHPSGNSAVAEPDGFIQTTLLADDT